MVAYPSCKKKKVTSKKTPADYADFRRQISACLCEFCGKQIHAATLKTVDLFAIKQKICPKKTPAD